MEKDEKNSLKSQAAKREEEILKFWKENDIFNKSLEKDSPKGEYVFYEGPPTANGKPGIHHLEARAFKDVIPRYKTMQGFHVRRKGGWDTHGLPVELQVEKKLGLASKKAIEEYGIAQFNKECKESVWEYVDLWEKFTERIGYWVDQENPYVTYHNNYIESVWNVIKETDKQKLLYKDYKVVPWCPRCGTALSSHELAQGYLDVKDLSVYVKFKVITDKDRLKTDQHRLNQGQSGDNQSESESKTYILAWTTTPWTLPGNVALAVGKDIEYVKVEVSEKVSVADLGVDGSHQESQEISFENFILAESKISVIDNNKYDVKIISKLKGSDLIGLEYEPLYPYLQELISDTEKPKLEKAFKVYPADFVTTEDGTGVVHTAVMYGQDDFELGTKVGLPKHHLVGLDGKFLKGTGFLEGRSVREVNENGKPTLAVDIIEDLKKRNLFFKQENYQHSYPHCWRCKTALIYYARDSWYIRMSALRDKMVEENKGINWEPSYIKEGRFGEWLKDVKDWAISRERYWGTPLPVWICDKCQKVEVVGSIEQLKSKTKKSGNKYFVMRHGEAENNVDDSHYQNLYLKARLTENGKEQVLKSSENFKEKIDIVISSPLERTRETTRIICEQIGFLLDEVVYDERIEEWQTSSIFEGKDRKIFVEYYTKKFLDNPTEILSDGESFTQVIKRVGGFIYDIESKYSGKNILIIGHQGATKALSFVTQGLLLNNLLKTSDSLIVLKNAEIKELNFTPLPHNENFELDLHKPYIDEVELNCDCGGKLVRVKEVMDCWLDSGTMPFSQDHYPFENKELIDGPGYPADFISEAMDQTRGWFYTLHAVGTIMGKGKAFKNVICLGLLLDANGKKMSKSIGNVVDPWSMMDKYGVDTLRLWMYAVNQPGESKNFDEKTVAELHSKVFNLLYNVLAFYELYRDEKVESSKEQVVSKNILDRWILVRLKKLIEEVTNNLENYKLLEPVRAIRDFIDILSTWYVRRSRERIKNGDVNAKKTLYYVLKNLVKLMAPFTPFTSEDIWQKLKNESDEESVHLTKWPKTDKKPIIFKFIFRKMNSGNNQILNEMEETRKVVTLGLQARQKAGLPVRQPLSKLRITNLPDGKAGFKLKIEYIKIIKDEMNVKEIVFEQGKESSVELDTNITPELREEGMYRELIRVIQDFRKISRLTPSDIVTFGIETNEVGQKFVNKFKNNLLKAVGAKDIKFVNNIEGTPLKIDYFDFKLRIEK